MIACLDNIILPFPILAVCPASKQRRGLAWIGERPPF